MDMKFGTLVMTKVSFALDHKICSFISNNVFRGHLYRREELLLDINPKDIFLMCLE